MSREIFRKFTGVLSIILLIIFCCSCDRSQDRYQINCFNDIIKTNAMSVYNKDRYYYVHNKHFIYEILDNGEKKCLVSVPDDIYIQGIAYSEESIYYIALGRLYRHDINAGVNNLADDEYYYKYISSHEENIYALAYTHGQYDYHLIKINPTEKVEELSSESNSDKDIEVICQGNKKYFRNINPHNTFLGMTDQNNNIIFRNTYLLDKNLLYADDNAIITSNDDSCGKKLLSFNSNGTFNKEIMLPDDYAYITQNVYSDEDNIYMLAQAQNGNTPRGYYNLPQKAHKSDALLKYNVNRESFEYIYKSKNKNERIIGYKDGYILLTYKDDIYKMKEGTDSKEKISSLNKEKNVVFEICGNKIFAWNENDEFLFSCQWK